MLIELSSTKKNRFSNHASNETWLECIMIHFKFSLYKRQQKIALQDQKHTLDLATPTTFGLAACL